VEKDKKSDGLQDEKIGQGTGQRGVMGQWAGQGHTARNEGTGSTMEIYRQRVTGRMDDREDKRKRDSERDRDGERNVGDREMRRRATGRRQREGERKKKK